MDSRGEFILYKLRTFCEKRGISIKYAALYLHKENRLAEQRWRTIVTMKNSILINSGLLNRFWAKTIETTNYLQNRLSTRSKNHGKMISQEAWIGRWQDLYYICIFGSLIFYNILEEKKVKSDYRKVWERILIEYSPYTSKHFRIWTSQSK